MTCIWEEEEEEEEEEVNKCRQQIRKNDKKNTVKQTKHQMKSQFVYKHTSHVTNAAWVEVFLWSQKNDSALAGANRLVKDHFQKSERSQSAP